VQGGSIRGDHSYEPGTLITHYDINREFPFPNVVMVYRLKGSDLLNALEEGIRCLPSRSGCFPQVSGIKMLIDSSKEVGHRITRLEVNNKPFDPDHVYTVCSTEFIRKGGDGYSSLSRGELIPHPRNGSRVDQIITDYFAAKTNVNPELEGRITFVEQVL